MSEKYISLDNLKEYNAKVKETYIKPLDDRIKDCPRTEIGWKEIVNGTYTSESNERYGGAYLKIIWYEGDDLKAIPTKVNVVFNGVEYNNLSVVYVEAMNNYFAGNLSIGNAIAGTNYPDTGEPFALGIGNGGCTLISDLTQSTTDTFVMSIPEEVLVKLDEKYLPDGLATEEYVQQYIADNFATLMAQYLNSVEATENKPTAADISTVFNEEEEA